MIDSLLKFIEENKYEHLDFARPHAHRTAVDYEDLKKEIEKLQRME
jgi:hypothetical protein